MTADPFAGRWTVEDSAELYGIHSWGDGYLTVGPGGRIAVVPGRDGTPPVELCEAVERLRRRGLAPPLLLRFPAIIADRLDRLSTAFGDAIAENDYPGGYQAVYPVKVNQHRGVVEEIVRCGGAWGAGLEVGSKPELLAVIATTAAGFGRRPIICNGFKDSAYLEAAILGTKLGRNLIVVIESPNEARLLLRHAETHGVDPTLGVRIKLASRSAGRWHSSTGARSKFGLHASELLELIAMLREHDRLDALQLVHGHPGSQLQDVRRVKEMISELAYVYAEMVELGVPLRYIDVGGGLGVDYDGSRTNSASSMNYTVQEYASEVVYRIASICADRGVDAPTILSESGRALTAHHAVLIFDVTGSAARDRSAVADADLDLPADAPQAIRDLVEAYQGVTERRLIECFHDAGAARQQAVELFSLGYLSLELRGLAERLFWATCERVRKAAARLDEVPEELERLDEILADTYLANLSVFQSLPDSWAIAQRFPVAPIHRLDERPDRHAVIADMTCDSDGKIDRFPGARDVLRTLPLHELRDGEPYYLAAFLVGAYQEALGDLHNLFGDVHAADVRQAPGGGWQIEEIVDGDTAGEVLGYVHYDVEALLAALADDCDGAVRDGRLDEGAGRELLDFYRAQLGGYTYLVSAAEADGPEAGLRRQEGGKGRPAASNGERKSNALALGPRRQK